MIFPQPPCHSEIMWNPSFIQDWDAAKFTKVACEPSERLLRWTWSDSVDSWCFSATAGDEFNQKIRLDWWKTRISLRKNREVPTEMGSKRHCCFKMFRPTSMWIIVDLCSKHGGRQQKSGWIRNVRKNLVTKFWRTSETKSQTLSSKKGKALEVFLSICVIPCVPRSLESCFDSLKPLFQTCVSGFSQTSLPKNLMVYHKCPFQNSFLIAMSKFSDKPRHGNEQQRAWHRWLPLLPHRPRAQGSQTGSCVKSSWNWKKPRSPKWRIVEENCYCGKPNIQF